MTYFTHTTIPTLKLVIYGIKPVMSQRRSGAMSRKCTA